MKLFDIEPYKLEWDSNFFDFPVYKCGIISKFSKEHSKALNQISAKLIYVQSKNYEDLLDSRDFSFIDRKLTLIKSLVAGTSIKHESSLIECREEPIIDTEWHKLILSSGVKSRFFCDRNFPVEIAEKLYLQWVKKAITDEGASFLILRYDHKVAGFVTFHSEKQEAKIGLIAVSKGFYRKHLGTALLRETQNRLLSMGIEKLYVTTQSSNIAAFKLYESFGFHEYKEECIGHFWVS